ncbi:hypothetical protein JR316_0008882 [Psilocybe cubensis]|uniref:Uncharacterized protein n=2 Tax=Psilocybe cubensis TaxID=181762 RepID=A0ACB8GSM5_PSICU|nr:hypothetical protein JR316_0008882 [Psilocybe cubensis]KAH9478427.1 hypothetical protein JR316_0008882 [Psilocybe cubensis]
MLRSPTRTSFSPPPSPTSPSKKSRLGMAGVANLFIRIKRLEESALGRHITVISSGEPKTQPSMTDACIGHDKLPVEYVDHFVCVGGVNIALLLRATRSALVEHIEDFGANGLINEMWECTISGPKQMHNGAYKIRVRYIADAVKSSVPDPRRPVALDKAKGIPGLMTIIKRGDD